MPPPPRIAIVHVAKTGGTWLKALLQPSYKYHEICPFQFEHQYDGNLDRLSNYRLFDSHIGYDVASRLDAKLITLIRNPFDRIVSLYHYWREVPDTSLGPGLAKKYTFEEFISSPESRRIIEMSVVNAQTWQIAFGTTLAARDRYINISQDKLLSKAVENLEKFDIVCTTEAMPLIVLEIREKLGIKINNDLLPVNTTKSRPKLDEVSIATRDIIYPLINVDLALYDYVLNYYVKDKYSRFTR